jgi:ABC-2 type transport system ATP-binding protein
VSVLATRDLTKDYAVGFWRKRPYRALDRLTLEVGPGEVFGFLGPNGAGKTTTLKLLIQLVYPTSGEAEILGRPLGDRSVKQRIGYLPENPYFYDHLTAEELLVYYASLFGLRGQERASRASRLLDEVGVGAERRLQLRKFSKGMLQRVGIAQALIGEPELIVVDEPTAGLDPEERVRFHNLLAETASEKAVVILSTHIVSDVANLCSNMAIIRAGSILATCTPRQALAELKDSVWEATVPREQAPEMKSRYRTISSQTVDGQVRLRVISKGLQPGEEFTPATPTLEDYYLNLVTQQ